MILDIHITSFDILLMYLYMHIPAFILLILGLIALKKKPILAKILLILATLYFLIGGGICGNMLIQ